ncbi:Ankyrin repeat protein [Metarhizium brunneum]
MVEDVLGWADGWSESSLGLEHAPEHALSRWNVEVVRLLLARFNYSPLCINVCLCRAADFKSPLPPHNRAERGGLDYVNQQQLISCLVDDELGNTPLHYAAFGSNLHIFSLYTTALPVDSLHGNVEESIKNNSGEALLHWAAAGKKIDILWFLLSSGADIHVANDNAEGWTPLHCLSLYLDDRGSNNKLAELATEFIARGVPVDARATILAVSTTGREALRVFNRDVGT